MAYIEDLVQEIYTNCHTEGIDKLNQGLKDAILYSGELERNLADLNKISQQNINFQTRAYEMQNSAFLSKKQQIKLDELQANARLRYMEKEENYQRRKEKADAREISNMKKKNALQGFLVKTIGAFFTINTLRKIINTGSELQLIQKSIEGLTGSAQDWQFLNQQAYKFGLSLKTVSSGYKNFYSSANMAGFNKNQIQSMFSDILLGARSIGASDQQIGGALLALEQMMSKGRVSMEELRRQLGNALPGAFEIGAKAMGVTTQKFNELVKAGISAQEFVPKFIKTFKEQYARGWADVEQTVAVAQGKLKVAWEEFTLEILHGEAGRALAEGLTQIAEFMRSPEMKVLIVSLGKVFNITAKIITFVLKHARAILFFLGFSGIIKLLLTQITVLGGQITIWQLLNSEIGASIWLVRSWGANVVSSAGAAATAIGGVGVALLGWLGILAMVEDMITGIMYYFGQTDRRSLTGDALGRRDKIKEQNLSTLTKENMPEMWKRHPEMIKAEYERVNSAAILEHPIRAFLGLKTGKMKDAEKLFNLNKEVQQDIKVQQTNNFYGITTPQNQIDFEKQTNFLLKSVLERMGNNQP